MTLEAQESNMRSGATPGQFFRAAQEARREALGGIKVHCVLPDGRVVISPLYSRTQAIIVSAKKG